MVRTSVNSAECEVLNRVPITARDAGQRRGRLAHKDDRYWSVVMPGSLSFPKLGDGHLGRVRPL